MGTSPTVVLQGVKESLSAMPRQALRIQHLDQADVG